jgi:uncharacterized protein YecT (DUF1311 family)
MNIRVLLVTGLMIALPVRGEDPPAADCVNLCADGSSTADLRSCLIEALERADEEVDRYYEAALEEWKFEPDDDPDPEARAAMDKFMRDIPETLRAAQEQWRKYVDADCGAVGAIWTTGSGRVPAVLGCRLERAKRRSLDLWTHYLDSSELPKPAMLCE